MFYSIDVTPLLLFFKYKIAHTLERSLQYADVPLLQDATLSAKVIFLLWSVRHDPGPAVSHGILRSSSEHASEPSPLLPILPHECEDEDILVGREW